VGTIRRMPTLASARRTTEEALNALKDTPKRNELYIRYKFIKESMDGGLMTKDAVSTALSKLLIDAMVEAKEQENTTREEKAARTSKVYSEIVGLLRGRHAFTIIVYLHAMFIVGLTFANVLEDTFFLDNFGMDGRSLYAIYFSPSLASFFFFLLLSSRPSSSKPEYLLAIVALVFCCVSFAVHTAGLIFFTSKAATALPFSTWLFFGEAGLTLSEIIYLSASIRVSVLAQKNFVVVPN